MASQAGEKPAIKKAFIPEFEGLRGLLAAWVILGHILLVSGFDYQDGWFGILFSPVLGVYVFMILSGFVITAALDQRPTSWVDFMTRRFFRLFPTYAVCMLLAIILFPASIQLAQTPALANFGAQDIERLVDVERNFGLYLLADATLLQCLLPRFWFPAAHESFLVPTWSLTLEWLFYLVAPLVVWLIRRNKPMAVAVAVLFLVLVWQGESVLTAINRSFNLGNAFHFLTGIGSYYLWKHLPVFHSGWIGKSLFWSAAAIAFAFLGLPYKIWVCLLAMLMYRRGHSLEIFFLEWPRNLLLSRKLQSIGELSYVAYLLHWNLITIVAFWMTFFFPSLTDKYQITIFLLVLVYPLTYISSCFLNRYLERPLMEWPKRRRKPNNLALVPNAERA
jgi:peptidoglycan/LPS O-acetylase OafA/YrhL